MDSFPNKKYNIIYADPPWSYRDKAAAGNRGAGYKYSLMTEEELKSLPVSEISAKDSLLFLWITMPKLPVVFDLIKDWGFEYKTVAFTWVKENKKASSRFWGMGNWTRANAELCLLATKGKPKRINAGVHSIVDAPVIESKIQEHSRKPDIVRDKILELCGDLPRIELFARESAEGWDSWGLEVDKFD